MRRFLQKAIILPLMVVVALLVVVLVVKFGPGVEFDAPEFPTRTVKVITAKQLPFRSRSVAYGNVEPAVLLKTRAEISGKISYIHPDLEKGASLARGTVVLRIEPTTFEFTLDQSRAGLSSSKSSLAQLEVEEKSTRRSLEIARENLVIGQKELARFRILWEKGVVTRSAIDAEEQKVLQLRQQVEDLEGKLEAFSSRKAATLAQIRKSETEIAQSEDTLGRTEIILPFDARIGDVFVEKGEYVSAGTVLYEALGTKAVEIKAQLPISRFAPLISGLGAAAVNLQNPQDLQMIFSKMKLGATVRLIGNGQETEVWRGQVLRIGEAIDPVRDTISVIVAVNNPYESVIPGKRPPLLKGMYVAVDLYAQPRQALVLPRKALHEGRIYVATTDNKLEIRPVNILHKQGQMVVIESGLEAGEKVVITDVIPVMDGLPLNPVAAPDEEAQLAQDAFDGGDIATDIAGDVARGPLMEETGGMIRYFAKHPTVANILMMAIIAIGLTSLKSLNKESFPLLKPSKVQVTVAYPGASPADVEDGICNPLEDATDGISFLKEQDCDARDNLAIFTLEMQEEGDIRAFTDDINTEIDAIQNFPDDIEEPVVKQLGRTNDVANVVLTSDKLTLSELKDLAEYYRDRLIAMPEIPIVTLDGFSTHQLQILVHPDTQKKYNLSVQEIADLIAAEALELPAGVLEATETSYQITFDNIRKTIDELADLVVLNTADGGEIRLGDIATIVDKFEDPEERVELNGRPAALLKVSKNTIDDTLKVADALIDFVAAENEILPEGTRLTIMNDASTSVRDRLQLLVTNGWQGLILATFALLLFFTWRYTFWIALGLPVSFLGGIAMMVVFGVSINMISMVALLMAIGILMDDAIVLSENIDYEYRQGKSPLDAAVDGTRKVFRGVFSSYLTSAFLFGSLLMMKGDLGQVLGVLPVVLLSVLTISLIEAFLILPHHLKHSLAHAHDKTPAKWRQKFESRFGRLRDKVADAAEGAMRLRYFVVGAALVMLILSAGIMVTGIVKFKAFPDLEGQNVEARVLLPQGTPLAETERVMEILRRALDKTDKMLSRNEKEPLVQNIQLSYGEHGDVPENGTHLATLSVDLLNTEERNTQMIEFIRLWQENTGEIPNVLNIQYKEPKVGPAGRAIHVRLSGNDLGELSRASWEIQNRLRGYAGVMNLLDDLRPGKPQYSIRLKPGALAAGVDSRRIAAQLRSAYMDVKIDEIYRGREAYEIIAKLDNLPRQELFDFDNFTVFSKTGQAIPLSSVAYITEVREFSRIGHINHRRTVNIYGDVDADIANTSEVILSLQKNLGDFEARYPDIRINYKGEVENGAETKSSILTGFALGVFGVFLLLSLQFGNYREPVIVMINIPLALIGSIWGHLIMGLDFTLPSMIGFVSLAGVVVNDSILLVEFVKYRVAEGMPFHDAAKQAVYDRFRAIFLTSVTTIAGMTPLLFETSTQALILVPLVTSIVFGMLTSTVLIMLVLPAMYAILEDMGLAKLTAGEAPATT